MDIEQRQDLQLFRLKEQLARMTANVPHYAAKLREAGVEAGGIQSLDDMRHLPFMSKDDLRETYPFGLFAAPMEDVVRLHASSGTTGKPIVVGYTREDIHNVWAQTIARSICCAGGHRSDILHVSYGYGLFTGGLGLHYGGELLGCTVIPMSAGNTKRQLLMMRDLGSTILACTPSYALTLADAAEAEGFDVSELKLRSGIFGAEPWSDSARAIVEEKLGLSAHDIYGLTEIIGPGVANDCEAKQGLHVFDDHFLPEIIDPVSGEPMPPGELGELVFTCLTKRAFPVLRFRTRDISSLNYEPCACGRTHARMSRIRGRTDDMLIIRGVNVFPSQIEHVLVGFEGVAPHYQLVISREGHLDVLEIRVEVAPEIFSDTVRALEDIEKRIEREIDSVLNLHARVKLVEPKTIERSEGKAKRVIDLRDKEGA
jgi:phenylacetate-CoA ligase